MPRALTANNAVTTLSAAITSTGALTFTVVSAVAFPAPTGGQYFYVTLLDSANVPEVVKVTSVAANVFTVVRAQDATTARTFLTAAKVSLNLVNAMIQELAPLDGVGATGTWPISVTGNAATATSATNAANATNATNATTAASCSGNAATATNATTAASCSGNAATATNATNATTAGTCSGNSNTANLATNANNSYACSGNAATATNATNAGSATNATTSASCSGNAASATIFSQAGWTITVGSGSLSFRYNGVAKMSLDQAGNLGVAGAPPAGGGTGPA